MSDLDVAFRQSVQTALELAERPDNDTLLQMYALYKQASAGDAHGEKPGFFDFVGTAKYQAWEALRGVDPDEAKRRYVELVQRLNQ